MNKKLNLLSIIFLCMFCFLSCSKEEVGKGIEEEPITVQDHSKSDLYKETSILVGKLLKDDNVRTEVLNNMAKLDEYGELVSFSFLLNKQSSKKNEIAALEKSPDLKKSNSFFKAALGREFSKNRKSYKVLNNALRGTGLKSSDDIVEKLFSFLADQNMQIYLPSRDTLFTKQSSNDDYYVSYATLDGWFPN